MNIEKDIEVTLINIDAELILANHPNGVGIMRGIEEIIELKDKEHKEEMKKVIEGIRNDLYDLLPTGDLNAFDIIRNFTDYIKGLDKKDKTIK